ncbi:hypothetical protein COOONC_04201 [Cooperia oncophora]
MKLMLKSARRTKHQDVNRVATKSHATLQIQHRRSLVLLSASGPACVCINGYVRGPSGQCIQQSDCPKQ